MLHNLIIQMLGFLEFVFPASQWEQHVLRTFRTNGLMRSCSTHMVSPCSSLVDWLGGGHYIFSPTLKPFLVFHFKFHFRLCACLLTHNKHILSSQPHNSGGDLQVLSFGFFCSGPVLHASRHVLPEPPPCRICMAHRQCHGCCFRRFPCRPPIYMRSVLQACRRPPVLHL